MKTTITFKMMPDDLRLSAFIFDNAQLVELAQSNINRYTSVLVIDKVVDEDEIKDGKFMAEELFDLTNNPSREEECSLLWSGRSMCVGDIARVDGVDWLCCSSGWIKVN